LIFDLFSFKRRPRLEDVRLGATRSWLVKEMVTPGSDRNYGLTLFGAWLYIFAKIQDINPNM
jgi:hypothetical protein